MILWPVLVPFFSLVLCLLLPSKRGLIAVATSGVNLALCLVVGGAVMRDGPISFHVGGRLGPLELVFVADGLSTVLFLTTAAVGIIVAVYALAYLRLQEGRRSAGAEPRFWLLWLILLGALNGIFLSSNLLAVFLFLEFMGGAAVGLVALGGSQGALTASMRYFFARLPGSLAFLFGIALLYSAYGSLDIRTLGPLLESTPLVSAAAGLMIFGVVVKASIFPFHFWLPPAHSGAIGPASAMLSGVVVKGPFYVSLRLWFDLFPAIVTPSAAQFVGALGAVGIVWGAAQALRARRLKRIIAYSTVSQMGFLFLLFPLLTGPPGTDWTTAAWTGGLYQVMSHAMAKAALLMAAGVVLYSIGSDKIRDMHGMASRLPITTFAIAIACVSLIGLPPSGGFVAKWLLLTAIIESGQWWWIPAFLGGALLTAAYAFLMLSYAFRSRKEEVTVRAVPLLIEVTTLILALASIAIGLRVQEPMGFIDPIADPAGVEEVEL